MVSVVLLFAVVLANFATLLDATDFLGAQRHGQSISKEVVEHMLSSASSAGLVAIKEQLQPTFAALPKNAQGQLEPSTVRYVLHRYFVQTHGWYVKGLDPEGASWNASSSSPSSDVMKGLAPVYIQELFVKQLHSTGLHLDQLAVFAATLSDLVFQESLGSLRDVYEKLELSTDDHISEEAFDEALRAFLADLITGSYGEFTGRDSLKALEEQAIDFYPEYDDIVMWIRDLYHTQNFMEQSHHNPFVANKGVSYDRSAAFLREFLHKFGTLPEAECRTLKNDLVSMEQRGTGRVLLSDFYANKQIQIHESVDYLRNLGVLEEESGPLRLIIANYISSPSRCMPFSSYYSVCCPDECDGLLGSLERDVGHPSAPPARIAELVSVLPSDTMDAPRNLSSLLLTRLHEIASHHGGRVPLHGRLFMQWMHHAYPRECSYPHASGITKPVSQDEWLLMNEDLQDATATEVEKARHVASAARPSDTPIDLDDLPWSNLEELVAVHSGDANKVWAYLRGVVFFAALSSFGLSTAFVASKSMFDSGDKIHLV